MLSSDPFFTLSQSSLDNVFDTVPPEKKNNKDLKLVFDISWGS